jgi:phage recombination protein Bet
MTEKKNDAGSQPGTNAIAKVAEDSLLAINEQTVTAFLNDKLTKPEMALFLNLCAMFQLNPFKREVYPIKYKAGDPAAFVIGYETYLKRAERTKNWAGLETGTEGLAGGFPTKAWARVFRKDWADRSLYHEVYYAEYVQTKAEYVNGQPTGKRVPNKMWAEKPITMLKKVAIAQAMRMAFPDEMAGLPYIEEELHIAEPGSIEAKATELKERAAYEASKREPLKDVQDEFTGATGIPDSYLGKQPALVPEVVKPAPTAAKPAPPAQGPKPTEAVLEPHPEVDLYAAAEAAAMEGAGMPEGPNMKQLEKFAKVKVELGLLGVDDVRLWTGIKKFSAKTLNRNVEETGDLGQPEMDQVLGYLNRWRGALAQEKAEKEAANGRK